nr:plastid division protein PDV1 [Ipomoea batatas]
MKWEMEVEEKEIEVVLEKIWDLHDKFSDAIHSISRAHFLSSVKSRAKTDDFHFPLRSTKKPEAADSDQSAHNNEFRNDGNKASGFVFVKEFRVGDEDDSAAVREAKSLSAIRTALENLEDQLEFLHTMQTQQRAERDVVLARIEQSRILLALRLAEHQGKRYKCIEEAQALVCDVKDASHFVSPESLSGNAHCEDFVARDGKRSNVFLNVLFSSFNFVKQSLRLDHVGGVLGNAALVAISMLALMHLQQAGCKEKFVLALPQRHEDVIYNRNLTKVSQPTGSSSSRLSELNVLSARG